MSEERIDPATLAAEEPVLATDLEVAGGDPDLGDVEVAVGAPVAEATGFLLEARSISKRFGGLLAVRDVDLRIPPGAIYSIIGPNGAGKTTFFNVVAGLIDPSAGHVIFQGRFLILRPRRTWVEPILWVAPSLVVVLIALLLGVPNGGDFAIAVTILIALGLLITTLLLAIIRPIWYARLLGRLGIMRSARTPTMRMAMPAARAKPAMMEGCSNSSKGP